MNNLFNRSLREKTKLEVIYIKKNGTTTQRVVRVIAVSEDHILAYCFYKRQVRRFNRENILAALPVVTRKEQMGA